MPKRAITIGTQHFASIAQATEYTRAILNNPNYEVDGSRPNEEEQAFLRGLVELHPEAGQKIGIGIEHFEISTSPTRGTRCFYIFRHDGTSTDFSFKKCLTRSNLYNQDVKAAFRTAVHSDLREIKAQRLAKLGITGGAHFHLDHIEPTFDCLIGKFIEQYPADWDNLDLGEQQDHADTVEFADTALAEAFRAFHSKHARLQMIPKATNLSERKRGLRKKQLTKKLLIYTFEEDWAKDYPL